MRKNKVKSVLLTWTAPPPEISRMRNRSLALVLALAACETESGTSETNADQGPAPVGGHPSLGDAGSGGATGDALPILDAERDAAPPVADQGPVFVDGAPDDMRAPDSDFVCAPGIPAGCADRSTQYVCNADGTAVDTRSCPNGAACRAGECVSDCLVEGKDPAYIGCTYWSADLDNYPDPFGDPSAVPHAVVIANASAAVATVTITTQSDIQLGNNQLNIEPGAIAVYTFPRADVDGSVISSRSFKIESNWPVAAYQFNPLNNVDVFSNDGTALIPDEALGHEYWIFSWPTSPIPDGFGFPPQHGYFAVIATREGETEVRVTPSVPVDAGDGVPALPAGEEHVFMLQQGQVLQLQASGDDLLAGNWDLTGSHVLASQPVAVFGGHEEAVVGDGCCAEHLEEQHFPANTWGLRYLAVHSEPRGGSTDVWRVLSSQDGTAVQTIPPQADAAQFTLDRGEWKEIPAQGSFEVVADKPISVAQYTASQETTADFIGDPDLVLAVPVEQFRASYLILTPADYTEDWLTVIRPAGQVVFLDGEVLADGLFEPVGSGDYEFTWVAVQDGPHVVIGDAPFGLVAMGYSQAVSYGYAAGFDLRPRRDGP